MAGRRGAASKAARRQAPPRETPAGRPPAARGTGYEIRAVGNDVTEIYLYDEISWWGVSATEFVDELRGIRTASIDLHVNSPGGDVFDGLAIYNALVSHPANVTTYVDGLAASAASYVALAGDTVKVARNAMVMIHEASGIVWGNADDMREMATLLEKIGADIADIYAQRGVYTQDEYRELMRAETWFTGQEAVDAGLADETFNDRSGDGDDDSEPENAFDLSVFAFAGRAAQGAPKLPDPHNESDPAPAPGDGDDPDQGAPDEPASEPGTTADPEPDPFDFDSAAIAASLKGAFA